MNGYIYIYVYIKLKKWDVLQKFLYQNTFSFPKPFVKRSNDDRVEVVTKIKKRK